MISFDEFLKQDEADKYNMLQECNAIIQQKGKEIERLNNIINELESWLISWIENEQYCFMANNPKDRCRREIYEEVLHHFKELKGSDKE